MILNACNSAISESLLVGLLSKSGLSWNMHKAQLYALQVMLGDGINAQSEVSGDVEELVPKPHGLTLFGIPIVIDKKQAPSVILLADDSGREISRIDGLAIPAVYCE